MRDRDQSPVSRRARPAKPPLSRETIAAAALRVVDAEGLGALTMRRVARELDTGAASLYVYVENREDLLAAMIDSELATVENPTEGSWQEKVTALVQSQIAALTRHRSLAVAALGAIPISPNASRVGEHLLNAVLESGVDQRTAAWAVDLIGLWTSATAAEKTINDQRGADGAVEADYLDRIDEYYRTLDPADHPTTLAMRDLLLSGSDDQRAAWGLGVILNGILATPVPAPTE
ncbi:TetR/AcrR family transcriptional regulator [Cellulomonas sp. P22]|uniref:TetR/AcrR family transcriptional regulator n=1 Tax=Cellulomonas sp. P22 TaxID=3373189 RepID=UPI0037A38AF6